MERHQRLSYLLADTQSRLSRLMGSLSACNVLSQVGFFFFSIFPSHFFLDTLTRAVCFFFFCIVLPQVRFLFQFIVFHSFGTCYVLSQGVPSFHLGVPSFHHSLKIKKTSLINGVPSFHHSYVVLSQGVPSFHHSLKIKKTSLIKGVPSFHHSYGSCYVLSQGVPSFHLLTHTYAHVHSLCHTHPHTHAGIHIGAHE